MQFLSFILSCLPLLYLNLKPFSLSFILFPFILHLLPLPSSGLCLSGVREGFWCSVPSQGLHFHLLNPDIHLLLNSPGSPVPQNSKEKEKSFKNTLFKNTDQSLSDGSKPRRLRRRLPTVSVHFPTSLQTFSSPFVNYP